MQYQHIRIPNISNTSQYMEARAFLCPAYPIREETEDTNSNFIK